MMGEEWDEHSILAKSTVVRDVMADIRSAYAVLGQGTRAYGADCSFTYSYMRTSASLAPRNDEDQSRCPSMGSAIFCRNWRCGETGSSRGPLFVVTTCRARRTL